MVLIPAGDYWMGRTHTASLEQAIILERDRRDDQPAHKIFVDAFYLDTHEVTNADYAKFVAATNAAKPWHWPKGTVATGRGAMASHQRHVGRGRRVLSLGREAAADGSRMGARGARRIGSKALSVGR